VRHDRSELARVEQVDESTHREGSGHKPWSVQIQRGPETMDVADFVHRPHYVGGLSRARSTTRRPLCDPPTVGRFASHHKCHRFVTRRTAGPYASPLGSLVTARRPAPFAPPRFPPRGAPAESRLARYPSELSAFRHPSGCTTPNEMTRSELSWFAGRGGTWRVTVACPFGRSCPMVHGLMSHVLHLDLQPPRGCLGRRGYHNHDSSAQESGTRGRAHDPR
jgi:hypothetical protein